MKHDTNIPATMVKPLNGAHEHQMTHLLQA